jgi:hypothetical protein
MKKIAPLSKAALEAYEKITGENRYIVTPNKAISFSLYRCIVRYR